MKVLHNGQAVILGLEKLNLDAFPQLRVVGCNMTGTEHLPIEEMERRGIKLISLKGEKDFLRTITSTAEHTIGLIIALLRNYKTALNGPYQDREAYKGHTLSGKTLGIIGLGRVGRQVMNIAQMFCMHVASFDKDYKSIQATEIHRVMTADVLSLHIPLVGNEGFFTRDMFEQMRSTSYFVNTSRSGVVEPGALLWALENKLIAGAAVDFTDDEALVQYAATHDNLILTNHIGGNTHEDRQRTEEFIERKVEEYLIKNKK